MFTKKIYKTLLTGFAIAFFAQASFAEITLKLGTTGRLGMPIGDAIDQALMPALESLCWQDENRTILSKKFMC